MQFATWAMAFSSAKGATWLVPSRTLQLCLVKLRKDPKWMSLRLANITSEISVCAVFVGDVTTVTHESSVWHFRSGETSEASG